MTQGLLNNWLSHVAMINCVSPRYTFLNHTGEREIPENILKREIHENILKRARNKNFSTESERRPHPPGQWFLTRWSLEKLRKVRWTLKGRGIICQNWDWRKNMFYNIYLGVEYDASLRLWLVLEYTRHSKVIHHHHHRKSKHSYVCVCVFRSCQLCMGPIIGSSATHFIGTGWGHRNP